MATKNRKCLACGERYTYCPDCSRADALKPAWSSQFCCESCATMWSTLTKFGMGRLTKSEAKDIISNLELQPIESYMACVQRDYAKIMHEDKKTRKSHKIIEPIVVEPIIEEQLEEVVEHMVIEPVHEVVEIENDKEL